MFNPPLYTLLVILVTIIKHLLWNRDVNSFKKANIASLNDK